MRQGSEYVVSLSHSGSGITNPYTELLCLPFDLWTWANPKTERELAFWLHLMLLLISCSLFCANGLTRGQLKGLSVGQQEVSLDKRSKFRNASLDFILIQILVKLSSWGQSQNKNELTGSLWAFQKVLFKVAVPSVQCYTETQNRGKAKVQEGDMNSLIKCTLQPHLKHVY